jgi:RND superfamily putative drug exporter
MNSIAKVVNRFPALTASLGLVATLVAAIYGLQVFDHLSSGGYADPSSESWQTQQILEREFGGQRTDVVLLLESAGGSTMTTGDNAKTAQRILDEVAKTSGVDRVSSYFSTNSPLFVSQDGRQTFAALALAGTLDGEQLKTLAALQDRWPDNVAGVKLYFGGSTTINQQISNQISEDLKKAEVLSFPILAVLLVLVFRSVVAALVPLGLGALSIVVAFALTRLITTVTDVSVYAINVITFMGLGLAIDYSLFLVSRFREELAGGATVPVATTTTLRTAGRTVGFSALTVILCLLGLTVFPQNFLQSMGYGGAAVVAATAVLALTFMMAVLRLLGRRINSWALPGLHAHVSRQVEHGFWYRYSHLVMRRPVIMLVLALGLLLAVGSSFLRVQFSLPGGTAVPTNLSSRYVTDALQHNFNSSGSAVTVVLQADGAARDASRQQPLSQYLDKLSAVDGIGTARVAGVEGNYVYIQAPETNEAQSQAARDTIARVRGLPVPGGWQLFVGGPTAELVDVLSGTQRQLPWALLIIAETTFILFVLMLGSVVIPIKAMILNVLSLSAAFGLLVWLFQDKHLAGLLHLNATGTLDANQPVLIFAIAFGLAMDYELFLLSRIKEAYDRTGNNATAVAEGVEHTAGIITSAAVMLVVVIGLFATSKISIIQQVGIGLAAAVLIDATIVRMILVPATMEILGRANWWAPAFVKRFVDRANLGE